MSKCETCSTEVPEGDRYCWPHRPYDPALEPPQKAQPADRFACSNCGSPFKTGLTLMQSDSMDSVKSVARICAERCLDGVKMAKLVVRKGVDETFEYEAYLPAEKV